MSRINIKYNIPIFKNKKILELTTLSTSFGACCRKIKFEDNKQYVIKELTNKNSKYSSIYYEGKSLKFMNEKIPNLFPKVLYLTNNTLVMEFINNDKIKSKLSEKDLAFQLSKIHQIKNIHFGYEFDPPIGGLRQPSKFDKSWIDFYTNKRLGMIFEIINSTKPMPSKINKGIEKLLKNLNNLIPNNPQPSLIHGDLWDENILFLNGKLVGLIDPGIYYAHSEMEIAYLQWFNYVSNNFFEYYSEYNHLDKDFFNYSEIYQLYYNLLNVHLWSRDYLKNTAKLIKKFN